LGIPPLLAPVHRNIVRWAQLDIFAAAQEGKTEQIRALIESGRARATDKDAENITPLHWAAINGRTDVCRYLIEQGAEVNAVGGALRATPLQWAARNGLAQTIDLLLRHGANPRLLDAQGYSCLHSVTHSSNHWALLYVLCQPEVAIDEPDSLGHTPLHWAVYQRDELSTQILLKLGADPNAVDHDGLAPLHWAAFAGNKKCISLLLEAGADIRAKNRDRRTAEEMASEFRNGQTWKEVVGELGFKADGTRVRRPLSEVCRCPGPFRSTAVRKRLMSL
jgi:ankyrin repeat protein